VYLPKNKSFGREPMARREVTMNEIVEVVYQWHQGAGFKAISRSLGFDRKTVRKYVQLAQMAGITRSSPFPDEAALVSMRKKGRLLTS